MSTKPLRAVGYARVSSIAQAEGTSLADQQASIAAYAKTRGLKVERFYVETESGAGAKSEQRAQMMALMADVRAGDLVLCDKLDRWSRDPIHTLTSVKKIREAGASFYAVSDSLDPASEQGGMMLHMRAMLAEEEHKRIRARTVGTRWLLRDAGYWVEGMVPFGYERPKGVRGPEKNVLVVNKVQAALVRDMAKMSIQGMSLARISAATGVSKTVVVKVLKSPVVAGQMMDSKGVWMKGKHPAILSMATFEKSRAKIEGRRLGGPRPRGTPARTDPWIMRDVACCMLCGSRMTSAYGGGGREKGEYYLCASKMRRRTCNARFVRRDQCEPVFAQMLAEHLCDLRDELAAALDRKSAPRPAVDHSKTKARLLSKRVRTIEAFTDGALGRVAMREAVAKIDRQIAALEVEEKPTRPTREVRGEMLAEVANIRQAWDLATDIQRRDIVNVLTEKALVQRDKTPVATWRPIEEVLGNAA